MRFFGLIAVMTLSIPYFCHDSINAQTGGMNRQYYFDERSTIFRTVLEFHEDLVVVGQSGTDSSGFTSIFVLLIDTLGNIKNLDFYKDPTLTDDLLLSSYSYDAVHLSTDGGLAIFGSTLARNNLYLLKLNNTLEFEYFKEYDSDFLYRSVNDLVKIDSSYYVIGQVENGTLNLDIFVQKLDIKGTKIWEKTFGSPSYWDTALSAISEENGVTILGHESFDPSHTQFNDTHSWTNIFHIDTSGDVQWFWKSNDREEGFAPTCLKKYNGKYIYLARPSFQVDVQTIWRAAQVVCRNEDFDLIWRRTYGDTFHLNGFSDFIIGADEHLYTTGQIVDGVTWATVYKINQEEGDVEWIARDTGIYTPGYGSRNLMEGIVELQSGSLIAVGSTFDVWAFKEHGLILKVTKEGCVDTICTTSIIENEILKPQKLIEVYPNPASENINFKFNELRPNVYLKIFNPEGKILFDQKIDNNKFDVDLNEKTYCSGLYFWQIMTQFRQIESSGSFIKL